MTLFYYCSIQTIKKNFVFKTKRNLIIVVSCALFDSFIKSSLKVCTICAKKQKSNNPMRVKDTSIKSSLEQFVVLGFLQITGGICKALLFRLY